MDWHFLLIELLLFIAIGWLVFLALLFYWLIFCGGTLPFGGWVWLGLSVVAWIGFNIWAAYMSWKEGWDKE